MEDDTKVVLVVEDDDGLRQTLIEALCDEGFDAVPAVNGQDALRWLSSTSCIPGVILTDLLMPNVDGWQLCERLHADEHWRHIPVVILSSALQARPWPIDKRPAGQLRKPPSLVQVLDLLNGLMPPVSPHYRRDNPVVSSHRQ